MAESLQTRLRQKRPGAAAILLLAAVGTIPRPGLAGSATSTLGVSLTIVAGCRVFGTASGTQSGEPLSVTLNCDNAVPYQVATYRAVVVETGSNGINVAVTY